MSGVVVVNTTFITDNVKELLSKISDSKTILIFSEKLFYADVLSIRLIEYMLKENLKLKAIVYLDNGELDHLFLQLSGIEANRIQLVRYVDLNTLFTQICRAYLVPEIYTDTIVLIPLTRIYTTTSGSLKSIMKIRPIVVELVALLKRISNYSNLKSLITVHKGHVRVLKKYVDVCILAVDETEFEVIRGG